MSLTEQIYEFLYRDLELRTAGIFLGLVFIIVHLVGLLQFEKIKPILEKLPRNEVFGVALMLICFVWSIIIWTSMDLGEFYNLERPILMILIIGFFAVAYYVREFIAVRAIGFFLILAACPVLDAAFLEPPQTRLLLVILSYAWIIIGMFWVGMPYLFRDWLKWAMADSGRWLILMLAGTAYGVAVVSCAMLYWGKA